MSDVSETAERSPETFGAPPGAQNGRPSALSRAATMFLKQREASVLAIAVVLFIYFATTTTAFVSHGSRQKKKNEEKYIKKGWRSI
jgi:hypothetical protein